MDLTIRRNEHCIIGLPRCDYVFSSTRSCFIGYGFATSAMETAILKRILADRGIEPIEAGGSRSPGQSAFCAKICSKIIVSQFCIVLLNHDRDAASGMAVPNANVNMEYGLILGFNKFVIPFQKRDELLPFNVAGLDTVKYDATDFERVAGDAVEHAISITTPSPTETAPPSENLALFLMDEGFVFADIRSEGDQAIYQLGAPLGFNLLTDFAGTRYVFIGMFSHLRAESIIWRTRMLVRAVDARRSSWPRRVAAGTITEDQARLFDEVFGEFAIWLVVHSELEREAIEAEVVGAGMAYVMKIVTPDIVEARIQTLGDVLARRV